MKKYLLKNLFITFLISSVISLICLYLIRPITLPEKKYCDMTFIFYPIILSQNIIMTIFSLPIFLNMNEVVRKNKYYSFASFIVGVFHFLFFESIYFGREAVVVICFTSLPFIIALIIFFIRFRKSDFVGNTINDNNKAGE